MCLSGNEFQSDISERMEPKARCAGRQESVAGQSIGGLSGSGEQTEGLSRFQEHQLWSSHLTSPQQQRPSLGWPPFCW